MAEKKNKEETFEVLITKPVVLDGKSYSVGEEQKLTAGQRDNLVAGGYALALNEETRERLRREKEENVGSRPLKERDIVIATHSSGEQVAYPDPREKGPETEAKIREELKKGTHKPLVEELPDRCVPTGVPLGAMQTAQEATKKVKANVKGEEIDTPKPAAAAGADKKATR